MKTLNQEAIELFSDSGEIDPPIDAVIEEHYSVNSFPLNQLDPELIITIASYLSWYDMMAFFLCNKKNYLLYENYQGNEMLNSLMLRIPSVDLSFNTLPFNQVNHLLMAKYIALNNADAVLTRIQMDPYYQSYIDSAKTVKTLTTADLDAIPKPDGCCGRLCCLGCACDDLSRFYDTKRRVCLTTQRQSL